MIIINDYAVYVIIINMIIYTSQGPQLGNAEHSTVFANHQGSDQGTSMVKLSLP